MPLSQDHWSTYADPIGLSFASFEGDFLRATRACDNIIDERPGLGKKKRLEFCLECRSFSYLLRVGFCLRGGRPPVGVIVSQLEEAIRKRRGGWSAGLGGVVGDSLRCSSCGRSRDRRKDEESLVQSVSEHGEGFERESMCLVFLQTGLSALWQ